MEQKIYIDESELSSLLLNEDTADETLDKYFEYDDSEAFSVNFKLKENVIMARDTVVDKSLIGDAGLSVVNFIARRKRVKIYKKSIKNYPNRIRIVSEGDSWFQHPLVKEIIDHMLGRYSVLSLGAAGDDMADYYREAEYMAAIEEENPKFFAFSGGGNDLMGGHFDDYLNQYSDDVNGEGPARFLNQRFYDKVDQMMKIYNSIFEEIKKNFPNVTILVHGYDYVIPKDKKKGRWLGKFMEEKGITTQEDKQGIIKVLIDTFNDRLGALSKNYDNVEYIDLRGVVNEYQWYDEIHPDNLGFEQVALKFIDRINKS